MTSQPLKNTERPHEIDGNVIPELEHFTEMLEDVPTPAMLVDPSGTIRWQNKASLVLGGSYVGINIVELAALEDRAQAFGVFDRVLAGGGPEEFTGRSHNPAVTCAYFRMRATLVPVRDGEPLLAIYPLPVTSPDDEYPTLADDIRLSRRQHDVVLLLAAGRTTEQIAVQLSRSRTTVRNHIASLLALLGVHSRLQAVAAARKAGLIDP